MNTSQRLESPLNINKGAVHKNITIINTHLPYIGDFSFINKH